MAKEKEVDETQGLPSAVTKQGEAANAAQKDHIAGVKGEKTAPEKDKEAQALAEEERKKKEQAEKDKKKPPEETPKGPQEGSVEWYQQKVTELEQKYDVLQGKYNSEIAPLHQTIRQNQETIDLLSKTLKDAQQKSKEHEGDGGEGEGEKGKEKKGALDKSQYEGYGDEMLELVERVNELVKENNELKNKLGGVETEIKTTSERVQTSVEDRFFSALTNTVPDWETINVDQKWLTWLGKNDPLSGVSRQQLVDLAVKQLDVQRLANILNAYKAEHGLSLEGAVTHNGGKTPKEEVKEPKPDEPLIPDNSAGAVVPDELPAGFKKEDLVTFAQYNAAVKDHNTGRITEEAFNKIANQYQKQAAAGIRI